MSERLACFITPGRSIEEAVARVRRAEELGYEAVFAVQTTGRDGLMSLVPYAHATSRIKLGTGVLPALPRHPVALGIEAATFDEVCGGRLILGIGPSHQLTMENWYGLSWDKPFSQMNEYLQILRSIFTTDGAELSGDFYKVQFGFIGYGARKDLPIYLGTVGPRMARLAGAAADGAVLWSCLPSYIRDVVAPNVRRGADEAGRPPAACEIVAAIPCAVTENPAAARNALRGDFFVYMTLPVYRKAIVGAGYGADVAAFDQAQAENDFPGMLAAMSDSLLDHFGAFGTPEQVRAKVAEYREAGATLPGIGLFNAGDGFAGFEATLEAAIGA